MSNIEDAIPATVKILHRDFLLVERDVKAFLKDRHYGLMDSDNSTIEYYARGNSDTADTIIHEILHALWMLFDLSIETVTSTEEEEHIVRALATGMVTVFKDNPKLAQTLLKICQT